MKTQTQKKKIVEQIENLLQHKIITITLLAIISIVFYSNYSKIFDEKINLGGDNIIYYSCGKAIAEGKGYTNTTFLEETPQTHFPPGYSLFIAGLQKISPNDILFVKRANGVLLWLSLLILFLFVKKISKNTFVAFCTTLFAAIQTTLLFFSTVMMSEILFIFISLIAIYLAVYLNEKLFLKKSEWKSIVLLVFFLLNTVYIYFVRSVGVSMVLAVGGWFGILAIQSFLLYLKKKRTDTKETSDLPIVKTWLVQRAVICLLIGASFLTAHTLWTIRQTNAGLTGSSYESVFLSKTGGAKMTTWDDWTTRIKYNTTGDITRWVPNVLFGTPYDNDAKATTGQWLKGVLMCLVFLAGLFYLKKRTFLIVFFYVGFSMIILLLFPEQYQGPRYLAPLIPFFIFLFFNGTANIVHFVCRFLPKKPKALIPQIIVLFVCSYFMYPNYIKAQADLRATAKVKTWEKMNDPKMTSYLEACKFFKDLPDSVKVITRKPEIFYMYSGYRRSTSFPWYGEPDTILSYLKRQKATHVILDDWYAHAYRTLYPAVRAYSEKFKILKEIGKVDTVKKLNPTYVLEFNDEWGYHGERIDGKKSGEGYELYQDGRKYVGHFENDKPNGDGIIYDKNGNVAAKGQWRDGLLVKGEGELTYTDGRKYTGQYESNAPDGYGTLYEKDGSIVYKGTWRKGSFLKGEGTLTYQNGNRYTGQIENGQPHGRGTFFDSTGKVTSKGQWKNGVFVGEGN